MASMRKYTFDLDFAAPRPSVPQETAAPVEVIEDLPPPATFTEEDVNLARETALEEGRRQGLAEGAASAQSQMAEALARIGMLMTDLAEKQAEASESAFRNAIRVALATIKKLFPATSEAHAFDEIVHVVEDVIRHMLDEPRIIVRVPEAMIEGLRPRLEAMGQTHGFEGRLQVQEDPRLPYGDCRLEWVDGGAERDQTRLLTEIEGIVERALTPPQRMPMAADIEAERELDEAPI